MSETPQPTTCFICPPLGTCKCNCGSGNEHVCEHKWDGEEEITDGGCGSSCTCSKCGMSAMSHDMRTGP